MKFSNTESNLPAEVLRRHVDEFELRRQSTLLYLGNAVATVLLGTFGALAVRSGHSAVAWFTFAHAALCLGNLVWLKHGADLRWANHCFTAGLVLLFAFLIAGGGVGHTGPLWAYPIGIAMIFLQGAQRGLWLSALMLGIAALAFFAPAPAGMLAAYSLEFKLRFLTTFGALALLGALHEHARAGNQQRLLQLSVQLEQLAQTDPLTGLPNRRSMQERLDAENKRFLRHQQRYSIIYGDIDHFKLLNDRWGHHAGDQALQAVAAALRAQLRSHDFVSRWGGEEFLILLPQTDLPQAVDVAEKLRTAIAGMVFGGDDATMPMTMSFGVHTVQCPGQVDSFIELADQKLYQAKQNGRNRIVALLACDLIPAVIGNARRDLRVPV